MKHWKIGENSVVKIENTAEDLLRKVHITCGDNCFIHIQGLITNNTQLVIFMKDNCSLKIGPNQLMNGVVEIMQLEPATITIGESCLWSNCKFWSSDMHSIIDLSNNKRINFSENIEVGAKVWFGLDTLILKGAKIADGCVIGARTVITKSTKVAPNSMIAGSPAKIRRSNISWDLKLIPPDPLILG